MANNNGLYNAAIAGAMAAFTSRWITSISSSLYSQQVAVATAFATQIDSLIAPSASYTSASFRLMESMCNAFWEDRNPTDLNPTIYLQAASALRAAFLQADAQMAPESTGATTVNIQTFTAVGLNSWTKPLNPLFTTVLCVGAGGGGGSGRRGAAGTSRFGGGGGGAGGYSIMQVDPAILDAAEPITVGTGGGSAAAIAVDDTNGNDGGSGSNSSFGQFNTAWVTAGGGLPGQGGTTASGNGGLGSWGSYPGGYGGNGSGGGDGGSGQCGEGPAPGGGGGGGGIDTSDNPSVFGGSGGANLNYTGNSQFGGGSDGGNISGGFNPAEDGESQINMNYGGKGAGGGYPSADLGGGMQPAGAGGVGIQGSGGGGGGASLNGFASGAGGAGGDGLVVVITICAA